MKNEYRSKDHQVKAMMYKVGEQEKIEKAFGVLLRNLAEGEWVVQAGRKGSIYILSDKEFRAMYEAKDEADL